MRSWFVFLPLGLAVTLSAQAQQPAPAHVEVATVAARPEDVGTLDGILKAFYEVISGPAGQPRQWSRDRSLYIPNVRFVSLSKDSAGTIHADVVDHQAYVDRTNDYFVRTGFFEQEIHRTTHRFGNVVHVFSTYDMKQRADGPSIGRGINSVELFWDGARWWISAVQWDDERPDNPIPPEYLPSP
ncbi:MAG TPA: hypothetical protein VJ816_07110 [Gemmatimonadales bacterium]|nr:hypothetical protein [Gemmatimonadales bacterium]